MLSLGQTRRGEEAPLNRCSSPAAVAGQGSRGCGQVDGSCSCPGRARRSIPDGAVAGAVSAGLVAAIQPGTHGQCQEALLPAPRVEGQHFWVGLQPLPSHRPRRPSVRPVQFWALLRSWGGQGRGHGDPPPTHIGSHGQGWAVWPSKPAECSPCPVSKQQWTHMCTESPTDSGGPRRQPSPQRKPEGLWRSGCPGVPTTMVRWGGLPQVGSLPPSALMTPTPTGNCGAKSTACWWASASRLACLSTHAARPASTGPCAQLHGDSEGLGPLPGATLATVCLCLCWGAVACL